MFGGELISKVDLGEQGAVLTLCNAMNSIAGIINLMLARCVHV